MIIRKFIIIMLSAILVFSLTGCGENIDDNSIPMPMAAKEMRGRNYEDVVTKLERTGYTNVYSEPMNDLIIGLLNKDGAVDEVSANGKKDFRKNQRFEPDTYIIVRYHSFVGSKEPASTVQTDDEPILADTSDGMTEMPICSDDITHLTVDKVVDTLTKAGFVNIKKEPLGDLIFGIVYSNEEITEVSVGGDTEYNKGDRYYPDVRIVIRYHSFD